VTTTPSPLRRLYAAWLRRVLAEVTASGLHTADAANQCPACLGRPEVAAWARDGRDDEPNTLTDR
jgi:hypothetical protein